MCTCYMWMSQVVVRVVEPAMERVPEIVMVAIVCQSLNPSQKQVHMRYVYPPIHGEWHETLHARSPDPKLPLYFLREGCGSRDYPSPSSSLESLKPVQLCRIQRHMQYCTQHAWGKMLYVIFTCNNLKKMTEVIRVNGSCRRQRRRRN